jgi:hypothetical protein
MAKLMYSMLTSLDGDTEDEHEVKGQAMQPPNDAEFVPPHELAFRAPGTNESAKLGHRFEA